MLVLLLLLCAVPQTFSSFLSYFMKHFKTNLWYFALGKCLLLPRLGEGLLFLCGIYFRQMNAALYVVLVVVDEEERVRNKKRRWWCRLRGPPSYCYFSLTSTFLSARRNMNWKFILDGFFERSNFGNKILYWKMKRRNTESETVVALGLPCVNCLLIIDFNKKAFFFVKINFSIKLYRGFKKILFND